MRGPPTGALGYTLQCAIKKGKSDKSFRDSNHRVQVNEAALSSLSAPPRRRRHCSDSAVISCCNQQNRAKGKLGGGGPSCVFFPASPLLLCSL